MGAHCTCDALKMGSTRVATQAKRKMQGLALTKLLSMQKEPKIKKNTTNTSQLHSLYTYIQYFQNSIY